MTARPGELLLCQQHGPTLMKQQKPETFVPGDKSAICRGLLFALQAVQCHPAPLSPLTKAPGSQAGLCGHVGLFLLSRSCSWAPAVPAGVAHGTAAPRAAGIQPGMAPDKLWALSARHRHNGVSDPFPSGFVEHPTLTRALALRTLKGLSQM